MRKDEEYARWTMRRVQRLVEGAASEDASARSHRRSTGRLLTESSRCSGGRRLSAQTIEVLDTDWDSLDFQHHEQLPRYSPQQIKQTHHQTLLLHEYVPDPLLLCFRVVG